MTYPYFGKVVMPLCQGEEGSFILIRKDKWGRRI